MIKHTIHCRCWSVIHLSLSHNNIIPGNKNRRPCFHGYRSDHIYQQNFLAAYIRGPNAAASIPLNSQMTNDHLFLTEPFLGVSANWLLAHTHTPMHSYEHTYTHTPIRTCTQWSHLVGHSASQYPRHIQVFHLLFLNSERHRYIKRKDNDFLCLNSKKKKIYRIFTWRLTL